MRFLRRSRGGDAGSATVAAAAMVAVLLCVTGAGAYLGSVVVARHRAQAAADLAALAGAAALPSGVAAACARATAVAHQMRIDDARCRVDGLDVVVTARVPVAFAGMAQAAARAGPPVPSSPGPHRVVRRRSAIAATPSRRRCPARALPD